MPLASQSSTRPALLFIPDISGFTKFVQATEVEHSQHIIEELLEALIEANTLGLQVSEVEGDAILFYRFGKPPSPEEFFRQVRTMFVNFHSRLRLYQSHRICDCGACATATDLTLKIVSHFGSISESRIKEHSKLFGQDVITVHRLLKNGIEHHEYALFTQSLAGEWTQISAWAPPQEGSQEYDVGRVHYQYVPLAPLLQFVPEAPVSDFSPPGINLRIFSVELEIEAPQRFVFDVATDLPARLQWMQGAKEVQLLNDQLNRVGTKHRCIIDPDSPVMVTTGSSRTVDTISFTETDEQQRMSSVYTLRRIGDTQTSMRIDGFIRNRISLRILFALYLRKKLERLFQVSGRNLKKYCEELYNRENP